MSNGKMSSIKNEYQKLSKKYNLPPFEKIDDEFEISTIDNQIFLLREIRRRLIEKLEIIIKLFDELIQPDASSYSQLYECRAFNDEEKKELYHLYKNLLALDRESLIVGLQTDNKKEADFINKVLNKWLEDKERIIRIVSKLKKSWETESKSDEELGYFG
jgi:GTPase SAR1 family protein